MALDAATVSLYQASDLKIIAPEIILAVWGCALLVMGVLLPYKKALITAWFAIVGIAIAAISLIAQWQFTSVPATGFYGMIRVDGFAVFFGLIFLLGAGLVIAISMRFLDIESEQHGEYYALVLFATTGMMFLACGYDLIVLYVSLELMALTFYVLVGFTKRERRSNEASMKYFLLGAFSSGILLYGFSILFGVGGSTNLGEIGPKIATAMSGASQSGIISLRPLLLLGMISVAAGLFFKISAVPFHMWAPDVYEGAPTPITAFLSTASKAASFALLARIFTVALASMYTDWAPIMGLTAAITILVGNWGAVTQTNSKRLLAYSSVSNAGYLLLGVIAGNEYGYLGLGIYLLVYTLMNVGAFGIIISLRRRGLVGDNVEDFAGLAKRDPLVAAAMVIFMLSLGGMPITGGFIGKYFLFGGLIQRAAAEHKSWYLWLLIWAVLNTVVSFYYYFRFIRVMLLDDETKIDEHPLSITPALQTGLAICMFGVLFIGIYPQPIISIAKELIAHFG